MYVCVAWGLLPHVVVGVLVVWWFGGWWCVWCVVLVFVVCCLGAYTHVVWCVGDLV